ncbi:MAG: amidohydrolase, partial [Candidatus Thermoplasmatota archaeon]
MKYVQGDILTEKGFEKGYLEFNEKNISKNKGIPPKKPIVKGYILPTFFNSHTHIGDFFVKEKNIKLPQKLEKLVEPPNGLKHRLLRNTDEKTITSGMAKA